MTSKPLNRLMFARGGLCFFCNQPLSKGDASVEHLLASANGGNNHDGNCVACCKALNALLGSMSLKEKFQLMLNQKGDFKCPNSVAVAFIRDSTAIPPIAPRLTKNKSDKITLVLANLKQRGNSRPRTVKTLKSTIGALFAKDISEADLTQLVGELQAIGKIVLTNDKISYLL